MVMPFAHVSAVRIIGKVQRMVQAESQQRFRRDAKFMSAGYYLGSGSAGCAGCSTDRGSFPSASDRANDGTEQRSSAEKLGGPLVFAYSGAVRSSEYITRRIDHIAPTVDRYGIQVNSELVGTDLTYDHFGRRSSWNYQLTIRRVDVAIYDRRIDSTKIRPLQSDSFRCSDRNFGAGRNYVRPSRNVQNE
jgi:hypothetical protein